MPPVRAARLRAPGYTAIPYSPDPTPATKDIVFRLNVTRMQKDIQSGAKVLWLPSFISEVLTLAMIKYVITIEGYFVEDRTHVNHTTTPITDGTEHVPDFVDFEEAAFLFNHDGAPSETTGEMVNLVELQVEYGKDGGSGNPDWRVYQGFILSTELALTGNHLAGEFKIQFGVVWSPENPTLREWV